MQGISLFHSFINSFLKKVGIGSLDDVYDYLYLGLGLMEGMIDVLPADNMLAYCKNNATASYDNFFRMKNNYTSADKLNTLITTETLFDNALGIVFNCYYSA